MRRLRRAYQRNAGQEAKRRKKFRQRAVAAGTAAVITLGAGVSLTKALAHTPDIHELPVSQDADADLLADTEEVTLGYCPFNPDQNRNQIPDGVDLAKYCFADINDLPVWDPSSGKPEPNEPYKTIVAAAFGIETCAVCGKDDIVMIEWEVVNPENGIRVRFTDMGMHYLKHGSFTYHSLDDWSGKGRLDVPALVQALELTLSFDPNDHQLPVPQDADADLLSNREELAIGYRMFNPDQNRNQIPDGVELAKRSAEVIDRLPQIGPEDPPPNETYKVEHQARGNENCLVCGVPINMGTLEIINPPLGVRVEFPILSLHYMGHGSFSYDGTTNTGRTNVPLLMRTLEMRFPYDPNAHQLPVNASDLDEDFLADSEELAAGYNLYDPDQDNDLTPDGIELAKQCKVAIDQLPEFEFQAPPGIQEPYKIVYLLDGVGTCEICGFQAYMDYWEIVNPRLGLTIGVSVLDAHYMKHGSFSLQGGGRIDVPLLAKILEMPRRCGDLGTVYLPADLNKDCKVDFTDFIELADKWLESTDPDQDGRIER